MIEALAVDRPWLMLGDCLERMTEIPDGSVDVITCDLPYGTSASPWDAIIPFAPLWSHYARVIKPHGAIVLTASQPFTSALVMSNPGWFKYSWIWEKTRTGGFWDCKFRPLKAHEDVLVFSQGGAANGSRFPMPYYAQGITSGIGTWTVKPISGNSRTPSGKKGIREASNYPRSILRFASESRPIHPTQKPLDLFEYLVQTYSNPGETVLDNCFGSATTAVACIHTGRRFIGIEKDPRYFELGRRRIEDAIAQATEPAIPGGLFDSLAVRE